MNSDTEKKRPPTGSKHASLAIVLVRPRVPENIGAAARIACNMGIDKLIVVGNRQADHETMAKVATHHAVHLIDQLSLYPTLFEALANYRLVIGTTARTGRQRCVARYPRDVITEILPKLAINPTALVFGPEDTGLTNEELNLCHHTVTIPTADFSSLNLAQAVAILCYELYYGMQHCGDSEILLHKQATVYELEGLMVTIEGLLERIGFLNEKNRRNQMHTLRRFFSKLAPTSKEVTTFKKICTTFAEKLYRP